jgi:hypothetical protein
MDLYSYLVLRPYWLFQTEQTKLGSGSGRGSKEGGGSVGIGLGAKRSSYTTGGVQGIA